MKIMKITAILAIALAISMTSVGCAKVADDFIEREPETEEVIAPQDEENEELLKKYNTHKENASLAFTTYDENSADDFEYEAVDGKVSVKKYIGEREIVIVPSSIDGAPVVSIEDRAFEGLFVRAVYIPDSVEHIGFAVFSGCSNMSTLRIPFVGDGGDINFGGYIFGAKEYLENGLNVPGSLKMIILGENVQRVEENAFFGFKSVEAFVLPKSLKRISNFAFNDCRSLVYVNLPEGLTDIGQYAFMNCQSLYIVEIPSSIDSVGLGAFMDCSALKHLTLPFIGNTRSENNFAGYIFGAENGEWNESFMPKSLTHITILGSCEIIPISAFENCTSVYSITLSDGVKRVDIAAFSNCKSLTKLYIGNAVEIIAEEAFLGCKALKTIEFADNSKLEKIGMQAFMGCEAIVELKLPDSVKRIENSAFYNCVSLKKVSANGLEHIAKSAFRNCNAISEVNGINKDCVTEDGNSTLIAAIK